MVRSAIWLLILAIVAYLVWTFRDSVETIPGKLDVQFGDEQAREFATRFHNLGEVSFWSNRDEEAIIKLAGEVQTRAKFKKVELAYQKLYNTILATSIDSWLNSEDLTRFYKNLK